MASPGSDRVDLSTLSFSEIQKLEQEIGVKEFQRKYGDFISSGVSNTTISNAVECKTQNESSLVTNKLKINEKWEPVEMSSKVKPRSHLGKFPLLKPAQIRDPRFDDLSGDFDKKEFEKVIM